MREQDRNKAWGFTLFADDLRIEIGGKMSIMGAYQADIFFPSHLPFPISLPKFCALIMYYEIKGSIKDDIIFKVTFGSDNKTLVEIPFLRKDIESTAGNEPTPEKIGAEYAEDSERIFHTRIPIGITPFVITEAGRLRVRAYFSDGSILKLGSIGARHVPTEEFNQMLGIVPKPTP